MNSIELKEIWNEMGCTRKEFARVTRLNESTISTWLSGSCKIPDGKARKIYSVYRKWQEGRITVKKKYGKSGPKKKKREPRNCLKCDKKFMSEGPWNRLCLNCQETNKNVFDFNDILGV